MCQSYLYMFSAGFAKLFMHYIAKLTWVISSLGSPPYSIISNILGTAETYEANNVIKMVHSVMINLENIVKGCFFDELLL